jgi:hypothetical protein
MSILNYLMLQTKRKGKHDRCASNQTQNVSSEILFTKINNERTHTSTINKDVPKRNVYQIVDMYKSNLRDRHFGGKNLNANSQLFNKRVGMYNDRDRKHKERMLKVSQFSRGSKHTKSLKDLNSIYLKL